jgi:hypothetical protein
MAVTVSRALECDESRRIVKYDWEKTVLDHARGKGELP